MDESKLLVLLILFFLTVFPTPAKNWGIRASINIPLGGGATKPSWSVNSHVEKFGRDGGGRIDAKIGGGFGEEPTYSFTGKVQPANAPISASCTVGGQVGSTPDKNCRLEIAGND